MAQKRGERERGEGKEEEEEEEEEKKKNSLAGEEKPDQLVLLDGGALLPGDAFWVFDVTGKPPCLSAFSDRRVPTLP